MQSNYIPWKGYFDLVGIVDEFILFDDVQYTRSDWRNRNRIKTAAGPAWLSIPILVKNRHQQKVKEAEIGDAKWPRRHWASIKQNYHKAKYFKQYMPLFEELYLDHSEQLLSRVNYRFIEAICQILGIGTKLSWSMDYHLMEGKTERLVSLCRQTKSTCYLSGPSAKEYLDEELFRQEGIQVRYMDYSGYPEYDQLFPPFEHNVSVIDLIFNEGPDAKDFMKFQQWNFQL